MADAYNAYSNWSVENNREGVYALQEDLTIDDTKALTTVWQIPSGENGEKEEITLPLYGNGIEFIVDWGDGVIETVTDNFVTHSYNSGEYTIKVQYVSGTRIDWGYNGYSEVIADSPLYTYTKYLIELTNWGEINAEEYGFSYCENLTEVSGKATDDTFKSVTNMHYMFLKCELLKNIDVSNWNVENVTDMTSMFQNCESLQDLDLSKFNTQNVEQMSFMFNSCKALKSLKLDNFNTSKVKRMHEMFRNCISLEKLDLTSFDTKNVETMFYMFKGLTNVTSITFGEKFNTSKIDKMSALFAGCENLKKLDLSTFDTTNTIEAREMFQACKSLTNIIFGEKFNLQNVESFDYMFDGCEKLTSLDLSTFNTSNVNNMGQMFQSCYNLTNITFGENFDTSNVTYMGSMFQACSSLVNLDLSTFNLQNATDTSRMFSNMSKLETLNISSFDTSNVTTMEKMFRGTSKLKNILISNKFIVSENKVDMFIGANTSIKFITISDEPVANQFKGIISGDMNLYVPNQNLDSYISTLNGDTNEANIKPIISLENNAILLEVGEDYVEQEYKIADYTEEELIALGSGDKKLYGFNIVVDGTVNKNSAEDYPITYTLNIVKQSGDKTITTKVAEEEILVRVADPKTIFKTEWTLPSGDTITLPLTGTNIDFIVDWGDGKSERVTESWKTHEYANTEEETFEIKVSYVAGTDITWGSSYYGDVEEVSKESGDYTYTKYLTKLTSWGEINATRYVFAYCGNLTYVSGDKTDNTFNNLISTQYMFFNCKNLETLNVSNIDTSKVTTMWSMFYGCEKVTSLDVSNFDTSNVNHMGNMFYGCKSLKSLDVSNFDTGNVTSTRGMFFSCSSLITLDISNFDTSNVTNMGNMFRECKSLKKLDLSKFDTSKVTNMYTMFYCAEKLEEIDIRSFNTSNVTDMRHIFLECYNLKSILISNKFILSGDTTNMLTGTNSNLKFITISETPVANQFKGIISGDMNLYVPNQSLNSYITTLSGDTAKENIKPIISLENSAILLEVGEDYVEQEYKIADYTEAELIALGSGDKKLYGFDIVVDGTVNKDLAADYPIKYTLNIIKQSGDKTIQAKVAEEEILVRVADPKTIMKTEWTLPSGDTITLPITGYSIDFIVDWGDGRTERIKEKNKTHIYTNKEEKTYTIRISYIGGREIKWGSSYHEGHVVPEESGDYTYTKYLTKLTCWGEINAIRYGFAYCENLTYVSGDVTDNTFDYFNSMFYMFAFCKNLTTLNVSNIDTSNVTDMQCAFLSCEALEELDVSSFNTSKVKTMIQTFSALKSLTTLELSNIDTSNVTDRGMWGMFSDSNKLESLDLSNFKTSNVTSMARMVYNCRSLKSIKFGSGFNTSKVNNMANMFKYCINLISLDLSSFNTSKVNNMANMFEDTRALKSILISNKFIISGDTTDMLTDTNTALKFITISEEPVAEQFKDVITGNINLYVPNQSLTSYISTLSGDTEEANIKTILNVLTDDEFIKVGRDFEDTREVTVADYKENENDYYNVYGFSLEKSNNVNTNIPDTYTVSYNLNRKGDLVSSVTRNVIVEDSFAPKNVKASGDADLSITITFEKPEGVDKVVVELLNENGEYVEINEDAPSPYKITSLEENKEYEYRLYSIKDGRKSEYVYVTGHTPYEDIYIVIKNDKTKPVLTYISSLPINEYIVAKDTITLIFTATDRTYNNETTITVDDILVNVSGEINNDVIKSLTTVETESEETFTVTITNITGNGEVTVTIPEGKVIDKAGNVNDEITFDLKLIAANDSITDDAPTVNVDGILLDITSNQTSIFEITEVIYEYRESGDTEFKSSENNKILVPKSDTYYEVRTITKDAKGIIKESQITTVKIDAVDNSIIKITADIVDLTSGDVTVTIDFGVTTFYKEYSLDNISWNKTKEDKVDIILKANKTVYARYSDEETATESVTYIVNNIDKEKPIIAGVEVIGEEIANSKEIKLTGVEDIGVAGIKGYYINTKPNLDNATWTNIENLEVLINITKNDTYYIWVADNVLNISEAKIIKVDGIVEKVTNIIMPDSIELKALEEKEIGISYKGTPKEIIYEIEKEDIIEIEENIKAIKGLNIGETKLKVTIVNYDGTVSIEKEITVTVKEIDLNLIITSSGETYNGEWTKEDVEVLITANGIMPKEIKEKISEDGTWTIPENIIIDEVSGKTTITYNKDISGDLYYAGNNNNGNIITNIKGPYLIKVDKTAPEVGSVQITSLAKEVNIKIIEAEDESSGIKEYEISIYKGEDLVETIKNTTGEATFEGLTSSTEYSIKYKIIDNVGNETDLIDAGVIKTKDIIKKVTYKLDGVTIEEREVIVGTIVDLEVTAEKEGYTFLGWGASVFGSVIENLIMPENDITLHAIFKDETCPTINKVSYETVDGILYIVVDANDIGSGIETYAVTTDAGIPKEWLPITRNESGDILITVPGTNTYNIWLKDREGNYTSYEKTVIKDIFAPVGTIIVSGDNEVNDLQYSNKHQVLLKITVEDNESKESDIKIAIYNEEDYKNIKDYSDITFAYTYEENEEGIFETDWETNWETSADDGLKKIYIIFKDKAGNISVTIKTL